MYVWMDDTHLRYSLQFTIIFVIFVSNSTGVFYPETSQSWRIVCHRGRIDSVLIGHDVELMLFYTVDENDRVDLLSIVDDDVKCIRTSWTAHQLFGTDR